MESRTLRSHRCIGAVADAAAPCASFYELGAVGFVAARVGRDAFQILKLDGLAFQCAGPRLGEPIAAIAGVGEWTYVGRSGYLARRSWFCYVLQGDGASSPTLQNSAATVLVRARDWSASQVRRRRRRSLLLRARGV